MKNIIYQSEAFREALKSHSNYRGSIETYLKELEDRGPDILDRIRTIRLSSSDLYKKPFSNFRLLFEHYCSFGAEGKYHAFYIRLLVPRKDRNYLGITKNPDEYLKENPLPKEDIDALESQIKVLLEPEEALLSLPEDLRAWGAHPLQYRPEGVFYETKYWVDSLRKLKDIRGTVPAVLDAIRSADSESVSIMSQEALPNYPDVYLVESQHIYVLYQQLVQEQRQVVYLLYGLYKERPKPETYIDVVERIHESVNAENFKHAAVKAYPDWLLADEDYFSRLQDNDDANLTLSPEQERLLSTYKLPLFINGQAGSGKSTMLYYLFAHYAFQYIKGQQQRRPLYLTHNSKLLQTAKEAVFNILRINHKYAEHLEKWEDNALKEKLEQLFFPFQDFLIQELLTEEQRKRIREGESKRIGYSQFEQLYQDCRESQKPNSELLWYVIRTYIKGHDPVALLSPEAYQGVPQKDKMLSLEMYKRAYNTFCTWYQNLTEGEDGYWDAQDLVRWALCNEHENWNTYPVIFCDEAQDFSKIEIDLLLRLSAFSHFDLSFCKVIPFAFAGDPYQTINPTGFRWASLTATFTSAFKEMGASQLELQREELLNNYRCSPTIIRLANFIQYLRQQYLNYDDLKPQEEYRILHKGVRPRVFSLNAENPGSSLRPEDFTGLVETIFITPLDFQDGLHWRDLKNRPAYDLLKYLHPEPKESLEEDYLFPNLDTAASAKGLEHNKIILYNFGEEAPDSLDDLFAGKSLDEEHYFELYHFFNKLYVAITRAREALYIFDTEKGIKRLWRQALHWEKLEIQDDWQNSIGLEPLIERATRSDISEIPEDDPLQIAETLAQAGRFEENAKKLRRAAFFYQKDGASEYRRQAELCIAEADEFDGQVKQAGDAYLKLNNTERALEAYWKGAHFKDIKRHFPKHRNYRCLIANYCLAPNLSVLSEIESRKEDFLNRLYKENKPFEVFVQTLASTLQPKEVEESFLMPLTVFLAELSKKGGFKELLEQIGDLYHRLDQSQETLSFWKRAGLESSLKYALLASEQETVPRRKLNLLQPYLAEPQVQKQIFRLWEESDHANWNDDVANTILKQFSLIHKEDYTGLLRADRLPLKNKIAFVVKEGLLNRPKVEHEVIQEILRGERSNFSLFEEYRALQNPLSNYLLNQIDEVDRWATIENWMEFTDLLPYLSDAQSAGLMTKFAEILHDNKDYVRKDMFEALDKNRRRLLLKKSERAYQLEQSFDSTNFDPFDTLFYYLCYRNKLLRKSFRYAFYDHVYKHTNRQSIKDKAERLKKKSGGGMIAKEPENQSKINEQTTESFGSISQVLARFKRDSEHARQEAYKHLDALIIFLENKANGNLVDFGALLGKDKPVMMLECARLYYREGLKEVDRPIFERLEWFLRCLTEEEEVLKHSFIFDFYDHAFSKAQTPELKQRIRKRKRQMGGKEIKKVSLNIKKAVKKEETEIRAIEKELPVVNLALNFPIQMKGEQLELKRYIFNKRLLQFTWEGLDIQCFPEKMKLDAREGVIDTAYFDEQELRSDDGKINRKGAYWHSEENAYKLCFTPTGLCLTRHKKNLIVIWKKQDDGKAS